MIKTHCNKCQGRDTHTLQGWLHQCIPSTCFYGVTFRHMGIKETSYVLSNVVWFFSCCVWVVLKDSLVTRKQCSGSDACDSKSSLKRFPAHSWVSGLWDPVTILYRSHAATRKGCLQTTHPHGFSPPYPDMTFFFQTCREVGRIVNKHPYNHLLYSAVNFLSHLLCLCVRVCVCFDWNTCELAADILVLHCWMFQQQFLRGRHHADTRPKKILAALRPCAVLSMVTFLQMSLCLAGFFRPGSK